MLLPIYEGWPSEVLTMGTDCGRALLADLNLYELPRVGDLIEITPTDIRAVRSVVFRPSGPERIRIVVGDSALRVL